jgi:hypothetical protein
MHQWSKELKFEVLLHYTQVFDPIATTPHCVRCPFSDIRALSIDHIEGGGNKHRKSIGANQGQGGTVFYSWLKEHGYPDGYQTLCMNCQYIKKDENHEVDSVKPVQKIGTQMLVG